MRNHVVTNGECFTSIAHRYGFFWKTLWDHPENEKLKEKRKDAFTLSPGDVVHIPDVEPVEYTCATGKTHEFRRKGVPARLRVQLFDFTGEPRADEAYELEVDGKKIAEGQKTDGEGWVDHPIPPDALQGKLRLVEDDEVYHLLLGHLRPIEEVIGIKMRLLNLGFFDGKLNDEIDDALVSALIEFQVGNGLEPTGEIDGPTRNAIKKASSG